MPTFKVTDPSSGKSISLTGDSPPSETELNDIFSKVNGSDKASGPTEAILTNKPTEGFMQHLARYSPAMAAAMAAAPEGAAMGATAGTAILPGVGTVIGGAIGGIGAAAIGGMAGESARQAVAQGVATAMPQKKYPVLPPTKLISSIKNQGAEQAANEATGLGVGAVMPYINKAAGAVGRGLEGISGLEYKTPGVLKEAANDVTLLFGPGKKEAGLAYEAIKDDLQIRPAMLTATSSKDIIDNAIYALDKGDLSPQEALVARRALDDKFGGIPATTSKYLRPKFDAIAKTISSEADTAFKRALKSEALQKVFATNKSGGTSVAKLWGSLVAGGGVGAIPMSPVVQGAVATATGLAGRAVESAPNTFRGASIQALLNRRKQDQEQ